MDFLSACSVSAQRMGISYGKYMAMLKDGAVNIPQKNEQDCSPEERKTPARARKGRVCEECGKWFYPVQGNTKTCGAICSYERQKRRGRELYHKKKGTGENAE